MPETPGDPTNPPPPAAPVVVPEVPDVIARIRKQQQDLKRVSLNWCYTYYGLGIVSITLPAVAAIIAPIPSASSALVSALAGVGTLASALAAWLAPKVEWTNFWNAKTYLGQAILDYDAKLIKFPALVKASKDAERFLGMIPDPPKPTPPLPLEQQPTQP